MTISDYLIRLVGARKTWGPFLVVAGLFVVVLSSVYLRTETGASLPTWVLIAVGGALVISGTIMMFVQLQYSESVIVRDDYNPADSSQADYVVRQLDKNYHILRRQTSQGFWISGFFMTVGLLVIVLSLFGTSFGLQTSGVNLSTISGIFLEFISGTALLIYRLNFQRLNDTSDKLDSAWRILSAYKLTEELPDDKRAEATVKLIEALAERK